MALDKNACFHTTAGGIYNGKDLWYKETDLAADKIVKKSFIPDGGI